MMWESPDGTKLPGILFANWYNNGVEIPVDEAEAKVYWDKKLADARKFAATHQLLLMNGCDHQRCRRTLRKQSAWQESCTRTSSLFILISKNM